MNKSAEKLFLRFLALCIAGLPCFLVTDCAYNETFSETSQTFTMTGGIEPKFGYKDRYFILVPGDTALFYGTEICTLITNGILESTTIDSSYFRTITFPAVTNDSFAYAIPQLYQQGSSLINASNQTIVRYFQKTPTTILQLAYRQNNIMTYLPVGQQQVIPNFVEVGSFDTINSPNNNWVSAMLIHNPLPFTNGRLWITGHSVGTRAIAQELFPPFQLNGVYYFTGIEIKSYYAFHGYSSENNNPFRFLGTIEVLRKYFKNIGMVDEMIRLTYQKTFDNKMVQVVKKIIIHQRGPEGAKVYPDDIPN
jgi:hypothetical protein